MHSNTSAEPFPYVSRSTPITAQPFNVTAEVARTVPSTHFAQRNQVRYPPCSSQALRGGVQPPRRKSNFLSSTSSHKKSSVNVTRRRRRKEQEAIPILWERRLTTAGRCRITGQAQGWRHRQAKGGSLSRASQLLPPPSLPSVVGRRPGRTGCTSRLPRSRASFSRLLCLVFCFLVCASCFDFAFVCPSGLRFTRIPHRLFG